MHDFLDYLPEDEFVIVEEVRALIKECVPQIKEKLSYNVPFYALQKNLFFIWPACIPWGKVPRNKVHLGFTNGHLLPDPYNVLESGSRKFVRVIALPTNEALDTEMIRFYLFEMLEILSKK